MATKQTDTVAMTEEQLDTVVGGWHDAAGHGCGGLHTGGSKGLAMQGGRVIFESVAASYGKSVTCTSGGYACPNDR
jgi:hypothetical protein